MGELGDLLLAPIMYIMSGANEKPQRTHAWNIQQLSKQDADTLNRSQMFHSKGIPSEMPVDGFRFHLPILGGWRQYAVIEPAWNFISKWHIGWVLPQKTEISRIPIWGPVRVLLGPEDVSFFGLEISGDQIPIRKIGEGRIGDRGTYSNIQLC